MAQDKSSVDSSLLLGNFTLSMKIFKYIFFHITSVHIAFLRLSLPSVKITAGAATRDMPDSLENFIYFVLLAL